MRIPDIIAAHAIPGSVVIDLTPEQAGLGSYLALPPTFETRYRRELGGEAGALAVVARVLPPAGDGAGWSFELGAIPDRAIHVVFFERAEDVAACGLLEQAARAGLELLDGHLTQQKPYRLAAIFGRPTEASTTASARLRMVNEGRMNRLTLRVREEELERTTARAERIARKLEWAEAELARREQANEQLVEARATIGDLRRRLLLLERAFERTRRRLITARRSPGFRLGRALRVAVTGAGWNVLAVPARFAASLRSPDEILAAVDAEVAAGGGDRAP
jgi:hypothetical protein